MHSSCFVTDEFCKADGNSCEKIGYLKDLRDSDNLEMSGRSANDRRSHQHLSGDWLTARQRTLTKWVNEKLRGSHGPVNDLATDFADGVKLIELLETLAPPNHKIPRCLA